MAKSWRQSLREGVNGALDQGVTVRLEVFLAFRGHRIWRGEELLLPGATAGSLLADLGIAEPELAVLVNGRNVPESTVLRSGDTVSVLRRAEGGALIANPIQRVCCRTLDGRGLR